MWPKEAICENCVGKLLSGAARESNQQVTSNHSMNKRGSNNIDCVNMLQVWHEHCYMWPLNSATFGKCPKLALPDNEVEGASGIAGTAGKRRGCQFVKGWWLSLSRMVLSAAVEEISSVVGQYFWSSLWHGMVLMLVCPGPSLRTRRLGMISN